MLTSVGFNATESTALVKNANSVSRKLLLERAPLKRGRGKECDLHSCRRCSPNAPFARLEMLTAALP
jgi:hypothetical protein